MQNYTSDHRFSESLAQVQSLYWNCSPRRALLLATVEYGNVRAEIRANVMDRDYFAGVWTDCLQNRERFVWTIMEYLMGELEDGQTYQSRQMRARTHAPSLCEPGCACGI